MKSFKIILIALVASTFMLTACNDDHDTDLNPEEVIMSADEAAENVEAIMIVAIDDVESASKAMEETYTDEEGLVLLDCGAVIDTTWDISKSNANASANYTSDWALTVLCNNAGIPNGLQMNSDASGTYEGVLMSGNENGIGEYTMLGLLPNATTYDFNGIYSGSGSATSKKGRQATYSLDVIFEFTEVSFDKETYDLLSGTGTINLIATGQNVGPATFTGTATFNGDGTVTIEINGSSYTFEI